MDCAGSLSKSIVFGAFVLMFCPTPARSQVSVGVGYQALHLEDAWATLGINVDAARGVAGRWSTVAEVGLAHGSGDELEADGFNIFNVGGGVRWHPRRDGPAPFVQLLAGVQISKADVDTDTAFMLQPGAGIHIPLNSAWGFSGQLDWRPVFYREETVHEARFVIGARWTRP